MQELEEKLQLWQLLEAEIADLLENDPVVQTEVEDARRAYQQGDYQTITITHF